MGDVIIDDFYEEVRKLSEEIEKGIKGKVENEHT